MSVRAKKWLLFFGIMSGVVCACLGLETKHSNHLGWALLLAGTTFVTFGCIILGTLLISSEGNHPKQDRSLWLPCLGVLLISLVTPLEYLFLPPVLPRSDYAQDIGLILFAGGLIFLLLSMYGTRREGTPFPKINVHKARSASQLSHALVQMLLCPAAVSLLLFVLGLGVGYSSLFGLLLLLLMVLPGLLYRETIFDRTPVHE